MKSFFISIAIFMLLVLVTGCSTRNLEYTDLDDDDIQNLPLYLAPEPIPLEPVQIKTPEPELEPEPVSGIIAVPDTDSAYQELIKLMHSSVERLSALIIGLFTAQGEDRENGTLAIVFRAVDMEIDYHGIAVHIAEQIKPYVSPNLSLMQEVGIADPRIILEFQDMTGEVIYTRVIKQSGEPVEGTPLTHTSDVTSPVSGLSVPSDALPEDAILLFIQSQQDTIAKVREEMAGMGTFSIEAQDSRTIACVVHITDESISDKVTEEKINDKILPILRGTFAQYVPILADMGVSDPRVIVIAYNPSGKVLISTEIN